MVESEKYLSEIEIIDIMDRVVKEFLVPKFKSLNMNASGRWLEGLEVRAKENTGSIWGEHYTRYLVNGRGPSEKRPPVQIIEKWVNIKLGISGAQGNRIAWAISTKIKQEGTQIFKDGGTDLVEILFSRECVEYVGRLAQPVIIENIRSEFKRQQKEVFS